MMGEIIYRDQSSFLQSQNKITEAQIRPKIRKTKPFRNVAGKSWSGQNWPVSARVKQADGFACDSACQVASDWF